MTIAEQMGVTLQSTAYSVNVKERLDFSCAVFDADGALVANAPHMPVHLGSMGEVGAHDPRAATRDRMRPGDVYALNDPYNGGTHLPDVTVVMPVFDGTELVLFFVASRGHHADIGGITPGSMPPDSTTIDEEGVLFDNFLLVENGRLREAAILRACCAPGHIPRATRPERRRPAGPDRGLPERRATSWRKMVGAVRPRRRPRLHGPRSGQCRGERAPGASTRCKDGEFAYAHDDGAVIEVKISIDKRARAAPRSTSPAPAPQQPNNFNAPAAVTRAAVLYVFRTLVDDDIPMNEGCLKPIDIVVPEGSMLSPRYPAAVVRRQCRDLAVGHRHALRRARRAGRRAGHDEQLHLRQRAATSTTRRSAAAPAPGPTSTAPRRVHTHMTNSRLTDPEVLEWRYPVLLESHSHRSRLGRQGQHQGGDGTIRARPLPRADAGGAGLQSPQGPAVRPAWRRAGIAGDQWIERADGAREALEGRCRAEIGAGDVFAVQTPSGGGYGGAT